MRELKGNQSDETLDSFNTYNTKKDIYSRETNI